MADWRHLRLLQRSIPGSAGGSYIELPFECPDQVALLQIAIEVQGGPDTVIDFGLLDPFGVRGWSGGARREAVVGT